VNGILCELIDTAGTDEPTGDRFDFDSQRASSPPSVIDLTAQSLASERREQAAIRAFCVEATSVIDERWLVDLKERSGPHCCDLIVLTKADAVRGRVLSEHGIDGASFVLTSSRSGQGLEELCTTFGRLLLNEQSAQRSHVVASTADRCRESVRLAETSLTRAAELVQAGGGNELVALELRAALEEIGRVVGAVYTNDLLDRIFGTFCIGK
jgi:tRNA modification GTPase